MKNKKHPMGQYIISEVGDTEDSYEYVQALLPLIGEVIIFFNSLESDLDHIICQIISDRTDRMGLQVLHSMLYATKVDLYDRFRCEEIRAFGWDSDIPVFKKVVSSLRHCGTLRNRVVHANWQYTNNEGYTHVRFKMGNKGLEHEFVQYTVESLKQIIEEITQVGFAIEEFEEKFEERMHSKYTNPIKQSL